MCERGNIVGLCGHAGVEILSIGCQVLCLLCWVMNISYDVFSDGSNFWRTEGLQKSYGVIQIPRDVRRQKKG